MKTNEELNALREEVEALFSKLAELDQEELEQVTGGNFCGGTTPKDFFPAQGSTYEGRPPVDTGKVHDNCFGHILHCINSSKPFYYCEKCKECHFTLAEFKVVNIVPPTIPV